MLTKITDASVEPLTLAEAKIHLRVTGTDEDAYITALITAARMDCESRLQRTLIETVWRMTLDEFPDEILLPMPAALAISSVSYTDTAGVDQTLSGSLYALDTVSEPAWLVPAFDTSWPETRDQVNAVRVTYTAGYLAGGTDAAKRAAVPMPLKQWMYLAIGQMYAHRERTITGAVVNEMKFADSLLDTYRVITL